MAEGLILNHMKTHYLRRALPLLAGALVLAAGPLEAAVSFGVSVGGPPMPPPPPGPVVSYASPGPGSVWINGQWVWQGGWVWTPGYWDYPPGSGAIWFPGAVITLGGQPYYRRGYWGRSGGGHWYGPGRGGPGRGPGGPGRPGNGPGRPGGGGPGGGGPGRGPGGGGGGPGGGRP